MALPSTGPLSMSQVNVELGYAANRQISLGDSAVRALAGRPSGSISFSHLRGKSASVVVSVTIGYQGGQSLFDYGYSGISPTFGSRNPTTYNGATILRLTVSNYGTQEVVLSGTRAQNFFDTVQFQGGSVYTSASANFEHSGGNSRWWWGQVSLPSGWSSIGSVRTVTLT